MDPILEKYLSEKSCNTSDLSFGSNPNLEVDRASREFINLLKDTSKLLKDITVVDRADCKGEIPRLDMCGIASAGAVATSCIPGNKLDDSYVTYDMVKYKTGLTVDEDFLDCNKLGRQINETAFNMLRTKVVNDMELAAIHGDEDLATGDNQSDYNNLVGVNDGFLKLACACTPTCQVLDALGAGPSFELFMAAKKLLPKRYRAERANYRYVVGPTMVDWMAEAKAPRETALGDSTLVTGEAGRIYGNSLYEVPMWPEDMPYPLGAPTTEVTHILFTPLNNLIYFLRRKFEIETERRIACDDYQSVAWWTADFAIGEPEKTVLIKNVDLCGTAWTGCVQNMCDDRCDDRVVHLPC